MILHHCSNVWNWFMRFSLRPKSVVVSIYNEMLNFWNISPEMLGSVQYSIHRTQSRCNYNNKVSLCVNSLRYAAMQNWQEWLFDMMNRTKIYRAFSYWRHIYCGAVALPSLIASNRVSNVNVKQQQGLPKESNYVFEVDSVAKGR